MEHVAIPLTETLRAHMQARVADGFSDEGDYLCSLVALDHQRTEALRVAIQEGLDSGTSDLTIDEIFEAAVKRHREAGA